MKRSFWGQFWESSRRAYGGLVVVLGIPISFFFWYIKPIQTVSISIVLPAYFLVIGIIVTLSHMTYVLWENRRKPFPNVIHARKPTSPWADFEALCLLEPSDLFSHGHVVSFYTIDEDGYEILVGVGSVLNVQDDERILVGIRSAANGYGDIINSICNNDRKQLGRLRVKPNIPQEDFTRIFPGSSDG